MKRTTAEWVRKAEDDYQFAHRGDEPFHDQRCFHCQQSAEKYLKALLVELALPVPRTHNLWDLKILLSPHYSALKVPNRGLIFLTRFAVGTRYPGIIATARQSAAASRWATRIRSECRSLLGLKA